MYEREKLMSDKLIHKLTKTWQPSLNILPVNSYIGDRDNRYITVNRAQASAILRAGLPIDIFMRQTPIDMPGIIESNNLGMEKQTITPVWNDIHKNNQQVMEQQNKTAFIELWPISLTEVQVTYSIKQPILHDKEVIGYMGKSMDIRREKIQKIIQNAHDIQSLQWKGHHVFINNKPVTLTEDESRSICYFLTGNKKLLKQSIGQAKLAIEVLKQKIGLSDQIAFIRSLLSGSILHNLLEVLNNENL